jgi:hypothetical protein
VKQETYKFLADLDELFWFWTYGIAPLKPNELYFVSLSSRNKMLNEEERQKFHVSRSEMFAKQQIRHDDFGSFLQHIKRFEVNKEAYLTKAGVPFPEKTLVVYFNICNINAYTAMRDQINHLTEIMGSLTDASLKNSQNGIDEAFYKVRKSFDTCQSLFARNFGTKTWIDIDIDSPIINSDQVNILRNTLNYKFGIGNVMLVKTGGGIHCLIRKEKVHENPKLICSSIAHIFPNNKEIVQNHNEMIPCPGTWSYGDHIVHILNKDDFSKEHQLHVSI